VKHNTPMLSNVTEITSILEMPVIYPSLPLPLFPFGPSLDYKCLNILKKSSLHFSDLNKTPTSDSVFYQVHLFSLFYKIIRYIRIKFLNLVGA
jgi:hypothetical protein